MQAISYSASIQASLELVSADLGDEAVILNLKNGVYYGLNDVGYHVWSMIRDSKTMGEILNTVADEYDVERQVCERDVFVLLQHMADEGLIEISQ